MECFFRFNPLFLQAYCCTAVQHFGTPYLIYLPPCSPRLSGISANESTTTSQLLGEEEEKGAADEDGDDEETESEDNLVERHVEADSEDDPKILDTTITTTSTSTATLTGVTAGSWHGKLESSCCDEREDEDVGHFNPRKLEVVVNVARSDGQPVSAVNGTANDGDGDDGRAFNKTTNSSAPPCTTPSAALFAAAAASVSVVGNRPASSRGAANEGYETTRIAAGTPSPLNEAAPTIAARQTPGGNVSGSLSSHADKPCHHMHSSCKPVWPQVASRAWLTMTEYLLKHLESWNKLLLF